MTVLDASAAVNVLLGRTTEPDLPGLVVRGVTAPHHIDVEVTSALRGQVLGGKLAEGPDEGERQVGLHGGRV